MNVLMRTLTSLFSGTKLEEDKEKKITKNEVIPEAIAFQTEVVEESTEHNPGNPMIRKVIQAPVFVEGAQVQNQNNDEVLIKAQPTAKGDQCVFMVNRPLFSGHSWWFPTFESAEGSPLAESLFTLDGVENVLVDHSTVTVGCSSTQHDWLPLAKQVGANLRQLLKSGSPLLADKIIKEMPSEEVVRAGIQNIIDAEVNPGVAGHGGKVTLISVKGNSVTIQMGGGCQGCSAADVTLKVGIHNSFRKAVPAVGAIYDETDHGAGSNPYFS